MDHTAQHALDWLASDGFMPHGHCYLWTPELLWTFVISETIIVLSYFSIPFALMYFVHKRSDLQFNWMFKLFSLFIFACGTTHALGIWTIWYPDYWLDAVVKAFTAAVSLLAAILIWPLIPRALRIPSTRQLEETVSRLQAEVTQRMDAENELTRLKESSETRFQALFEQAAVGVVEVDFDSGRFLRVNRKGCELLGYSREELLQRDFMSITHPDDVSASLEQVQRLREGVITEYTMEKRYLHKEGHTIWVSLTVSPLSTPDQARPTLLAVVQDISARKHAEAEQQEQLDELRRWHGVTLGREQRILELKHEVDVLLAAAGQPLRYGVPDKAQ